MRWKFRNRNKEKEKPDPVMQTDVGDVIEKIRFAFFPIRLNENDVVWLEKYIDVLEYRKIVINIKTYKKIESGSKASHTDNMEHYEWILKNRKFYGKR